MTASHPTAPDLEIRNPAFIEFMVGRRSDTCIDAADPYAQTAPGCSGAHATQPAHTSASSGFPLDGAILATHVWCRHLVPQLVEFPLDLDSGAFNL